MGPKNKVFKDATLGYISVEEKYIANLIDTFEMQRLKDVAQTGIRPIYSGATHDRFSHSLGVYHIGRKIYTAFQNNLEKNLPPNLERESLNWIMEQCREYYYVACLLHDIGHPAFSHTFEYLYKNKYINFGEDYSGGGGLEQEIERVAQLLRDNFAGRKEENTLDYKLRKEIGEKSSKSYSFIAEAEISVNVNTEKLETSQSHHEKMGAYQILTSAELKERIAKVFGKEVEEIDFCFIACMITGLIYDIDSVDEKCRLEFSLKNCIIRLLNGLIDADSIDYLNRNSHFAGYATSALDVERLCNAFSAYYDESSEEIVSCFEKSALSTIECFINARNFEPKWLYNHHKIVFYDEYLVKYLYKKCNRYLFAFYQKLIEQGIIEKMKAELEEDCNIEIGGNLIPNEGGVAGAKRSYRDAILNFYINFYYWSFRKDGKISKSVTLDDFRKSEIIKGMLKYIQNPEEDMDFYCRETDEFREYKELLKELQAIDASAWIISFATGALKKICNEILLLPVGEGALEKAKKGINIIQDWCRVYGALKEAFLIDVFAPVVSFTPGTFTFFKSSDSDISALFKMMYLRYKDLDYSDLDENEKLIGVEKEFKQFQRALKEFNTRKYRQSLWKSEYEYKCFLKRLAKKTGFSVQVIHQEFLAVISSGKGMREEFEDPNTFLKGLDSNAVYMNGFFEMESTFNNIFSIFGDGMVIKVYHLRYKDFGDLKINLGGLWKDSIVSYAELNDKLSRKGEYFPYLFYDAEDFRKKEGAQECVPKSCSVDTAAGLRGKLLTGLEENFTRYLYGKYGEGGNDLLSVVNYVRDGKIIRDAVHGDIFVPQRFLGIIDTKAFQRLRRIKQLATADAVFPEAVHTRFAHSLGVFHIMSLMVKHFCNLFDYLKIPYRELDKDAILAAALLHDIGHGPYSHAFERISGDSHEVWTRRIILEDSELNALLKGEFGEEFPKHVIQYMNYFGEESEPSLDGYTLSSVFQSLINSQLDADRLDYLLRDSYNSGVELGSIDLQKVVSSLELTEHDGKIRVCVNEDAIANIEQIILGRYNMYAKVYNAPYKVFLEELLNRIVERIIRNTQTLNQSSFLKQICDKSITVEEYLQMDDFMLYDELHHCLEGNVDQLLHNMIESFYNRKGYVRLRILDETPRAVNEFLLELKERYAISEGDGFCGLICPKKEYFAYDCNSDKAILISKRDGSVSDIASESIIFRNEIKRDNNGMPIKLWHFLKQYVYINYEIVCQESGHAEADFKETLKKFVDMYDIRRHTEIEEKYSCTEKNISDAKSILSGEFSEELKLYNRKENTQAFESEHSDSYYDTGGFLLARNGYSLRCRNKSGKYIFSVKSSIDSNNGKNKGQFVRSEFEQDSDSDDINEERNRSFVEKQLSSLLKKHNLDYSADMWKKNIMIENKRVSFLIVRKDSDFECEVSLDSIRYIYNGEEKKDYQIEIELKSTYHIYKIELKEFAERLLKKLGIETVRNNEVESKYRKALNCFNLI